MDNLHWVEAAGANRLVVGSQARILYAEQDGRVRIALAFNEAIARKQILVLLFRIFYSFIFDWLTFLYI